MQFSRRLLLLGVVFVAYQGGILTTAFATQTPATFGVGCSQFYIFKNGSNIIDPFFIIMKNTIIKYLNLFISQSSILVGGQAVIEGVLMRVPGAYATAVRNSEGEILIDRHDFKSVLEKYNLKNVIILRGIIGLFESLKIGFKTLQWSADIAEVNQKTNKKPNAIFEFLITILSILFVITLFFIGPLGLTRFLIDENLNPLNFLEHVQLCHLFYV